MTQASLRITEIFHSLQGESRTVGLPTVFVRLTGCPLRCGYCDSEYAFHGGERLAIDQIVAQVSGYGARYVCVTGGEPLAQPDCLTLLDALCDKGLNVSLETSGAMDIGGVNPAVDIVMDLKTPASGEQSKNLYSNIDKLKPSDQVKFVICDRKDYDWSVFKMDELGLSARIGEILFSPSYEQLSPAELADWIISDGLHVRFQMQLHKQLWGDKPGV